MKKIITSIIIVSFLSGQLSPELWGPSIAPPASSWVEIHKLAPRSEIPLTLLQPIELANRYMKTWAKSVFSQQGEKAEEDLRQLRAELKRRGIVVSKARIEQGRPVVQATFTFPQGPDGQSPPENFRLSAKYQAGGKQRVASRRGFILNGIISTILLYFTGCSKKERHSTPFPTIPAVLSIPTLVAVNNPDADLEVELVVQANGHNQNVSGGAPIFRIDVFQNGQALIDLATGKAVQYFPLVTNPNGQESITIRLPAGTRGSVEFEVRNASGDFTQQILQDSAPSQRLSTTITRDSLVQPPVFSSQPQSADGGPNFAFNVTLVEPLATGLYGNLYPVDANGQPDRSRGVQVNIVASDGQPNFNGTEEFFITVPASAPGSNFFLELSTLAQAGNNPSTPVLSQPFTVTQRGNYSGSPTIVTAETLQSTNTARLVVNPTRTGVRSFRISYQDASGNTVTEYRTANLDAQGNAIQTEMFLGLPSVGTFNLQVQDYATNLAYSSVASAQVTVAIMGSALNPVTITTQPTNPNGDRRVNFVYNTGTQIVQAQSASANLIRTDTGAIIATGLSIIPTNGTFNPNGVNDAFVDLPASVPLNVPLALDVFIGGQNMVPSPATRTNNFLVTTLGPVQGDPSVVATVLSNAAGQTTNNIRLDINPNPNNQDIRTYEIEYFDATVTTKLGNTEYRSIPTSNGNPVAGTLIVAVPTNTPGTYTIRVRSSGPDTQPSNPTDVQVSFQTIGTVLVAPTITQQPTNPNGDLFVAFRMNSNNPTFPVQSGRARLSRVSNPTIFQDLVVLPVNGNFTNSGEQEVYIRIPANSAVLQRDALGNLQPTNLQFDLFVGGNGLPDSPSAPSAQFQVNTEVSILATPGILVTPLQGTNTLEIDFTPNTNDPLVRFYQVQAYLGGNLQAEATIPVQRDANGNIIPSTDFILVPAIGTYEVRVSTFGPDIQNSSWAVQQNIVVTTLGTALNPVTITRQPLANTNSRNVSLGFQDNNAAIVTEYGIIEIVRPAVGPDPEMRQFVNVAYYNAGGVYLPNANNDAFVTIPSSMFLRDVNGNAVPTTFYMNVQTGGDRIVPSNPVLTASFTVTTDQSPIAAAPTVSPLPAPGLPAGEFYSNFGINVNPNTNLMGVTNYHITIRQGGRIISETFPSVAKDVFGVPIASDINLTVPSTGLYDITVDAYGPDVLNGPVGTTQVNVTQMGTPLTAPTVSGILNPDGDNTLTAQINTASLGFATYVVFRVTTMIGQVLPLIYVPVSNIRPNGEVDFPVNGVTGNVDVEVATFHNSVGIGPFTARIPSSITTAGTLFATPTNLSVANNAAGPNVIDVIFNPNNPAAPADTVAIIRVDVPGRQPMYFYPLLSSGIPQGGGLLLFTVVLPPGSNTFLVGVYAGVGRPQQTDSALIGPATVTVTIASAANSAPQSRRDFLGAPFAALAGIVGFTAATTETRQLEEGVLVSEIPAEEDAPSVFSSLVQSFLRPLFSTWYGRIFLIGSILALSANAAYGADSNLIALLAFAPLLASINIGDVVIAAIFFAVLMISWFSFRRYLQTHPEVVEDFNKNTRELLRRMKETTRIFRRGKKSSGKLPAQIPVSNPTFVEFSI